MFLWNDFAFDRLLMQGTVRLVLYVNLCTVTGQNKVCGGYIHSIQCQEKQT